MTGKEDFKRLLNTYAEYSKQQFLIFTLSLILYFFSNCSFQQLLWMRPLVVWFLKSGECNQFYDPAMRAVNERSLGEQEKSLEYLCFSSKDVKQLSLLEWFRAGSKSHFKSNWANFPKLTGQPQGISAENKNLVFHNVWRDSCPMWFGTFLSVPGRFSKWVDM